MNGEPAGMRRDSVAINGDLQDTVRFGRHEGRICGDTADSVGINADRFYYGTA